MFQKSIAAHNVTLSTSNAPIIGHFLSDSNIELETSHAPIDTTIGLFTRKAVNNSTENFSVDDGQAVETRLTLRSSNG